ncbi:hypothetical protein [Pseudodonghicola flavimaris]|uniref:Tetratricopeptide repeat protein n=1 Tax=Pseudodonghicola flavimaris TaxID=3050036 RepID=A0ABT7F7R6_9RHOB|nr:hypothetical protein [Pseudodonghicola flavimaris]MDK3020656.1 hypothetical protein [Pseudodonghicola flavimaris]
MRIKTALIAALWPASVVAQEPLSVIDWLGEAYANPGAGGFVLLEPPVAEAALRPEVEVSPLESVATPLGLVAPEITGLPVDLWHGSDPQQLIRLIGEVPVHDSPAMQSLLYTLLLAEKAPPATASDAEADALMLAQIDRLIALGAIDPAQAMVELAGPTRNRALFRRWFDTTLLSGDEDRSCAVLQQIPDLAPHYAARIFCTARHGDWQTAALTLETAQALELLPRPTLDLLDHFLNPEFFEGAAPLPAAVDPDPLTFRLFEAIGERMPSSTLPRAFANADLREIAGWRAQIEAAERLTRVGALNPNQLLGLYTDRKPAASGGIWDRVAAVQRFDIALSTGSAEAVAKTLPTAWTQMRAARLEVPFAHLFADRLAAIPLQDAAAALAWQIRLLAPDYEAASHQAPGNSRAQSFLGALAQGAPGRADPPDDQARAIALGFGDASAVPPELTTALKDGRLGEVILRAIGLFDRGARGNPTELTAALATLRRVGLEDTARRAALQLMITGRG